MQRDSLEQRQQMRKKKRKKRNHIIRAAAAAILAAATALCINACKSSVKPDGTYVQIEIAQGEPTKAIAATLKENGLITSVSGFVNDVKKSEYAANLRYGVYNIERGMSNDEIIELLTTGPNVKNTISVTVPEGFSLEKIIERVAGAGLSDKTSLLAAAKDDYDYSFLKCVPESDDIKYRLQGFLFPSTYEFEKDADARTIIDTMLAEFEKQMKKNNISEKNLYETITLASLVEREAKLDDERAKIAGVIKNRIEKGMRLQIDATVVYVISNGMYDVDRVLYKDLETESPYNTYKYKGLPAGPICSPGIKSIQAAQNPEKHNYYYYRTDSQKNDGSHVFTETFDEHKNAGQ